MIQENITKWWYIFYFVFSSSKSWGCGFILGFMVIKCNWLCTVYYSLSLILYGVGSNRDVIVTQSVVAQWHAGHYLWMGAELKVHPLRKSFCLSTDSLLEPYTSAQSLLVELRLEVVSRLLRLLLKPATRGSRKSTGSVPLERQQQRCEFDRHQSELSDKPAVMSECRCRKDYVHTISAIFKYQWCPSLCHSLTISTLFQLNKLLNKQSTHMIIQASHSFHISVSLYRRIKGLLYNANRRVSTEPHASLRRTCKCVWRRKSCFFSVPPTLNPSFVMLEFWAFCRWH